MDGSAPAVDPDRRRAPVALVGTQRAAERHSTPPPTTSTRAIHRSGAHVLRSTRPDAILPIASCSCNTNNFNVVHQGCHDASGCRTDAQDVGTIATGVAPSSSRPLVRRFSDPQAAPPSVRASIGPSRFRPTRMARRRKALERNASVVACRPRSLESPAGDRPPRSTVPASRSDVRPRKRRQRRCGRTDGPGPGENAARRRAVEGHTRTPHSTSPHPTPHRSPPTPPQPTCTASRRCNRRATTPSAAGAGTGVEPADAVQRV